MSSTVKIPINTRFLFFFSFILKISPYSMFDVQCSSLLHFFYLLLFLLFSVFLFFVFFVTFCSKYFFVFFFSFLFFFFFCFLNFVFFFSFSHNSQLTTHHSISDIPPVSGIAFLPVPYRRGYGTGVSRPVRSG